MSPQPSKDLSPSHKKALAEGRALGHSIRRYLEALEAGKQGPGRPRTPETIKKRLGVIDQTISSATALNKVQMMQERRDLEREIATLESVSDISALEAEFIANAGTYSERKGIAYATWREFGVPAAILKAAGITRGN